MLREVIVDEFGRLVIPEEVRNHLQLKAGSRLTLIDEDDRLVLVRQRREPEIIEKDGLLVVSGTSSGTIPDHRELRDERLRRFDGLK